LCILKEILDNPNEVWKFEQSVCQEGCFVVYVRFDCKELSSSRQKFQVINGYVKLCGGFLLETAEKKDKWSGTSLIDHFN